MGIDGAEDLLVVTDSNLLMIDVPDLPADRDGDQLRQSCTALVVSVCQVSLLTLRSPISSNGGALLLLLGQPRLLLPAAGRRHHLHNFLTSQ